MDNLKNRGYTRHQNKVTACQHSIKQARVYHMENPIKSARLARGLSQRGLANLASMSPHALLRYEQGLYEHISPALLETICLQFDLDAATVAHDYNVFRMETQRSAHEWMRDSDLTPIQISPDVHPFVSFREGVTLRAVGRTSRIRFCILLAINPAVVLNYDNGRQGPMPTLIREALINAGLKDEYLKKLDIYGQLWHERYGC